MKLTELLKVEAKKENANVTSVIPSEPDTAFTREQLQKVWSDFAETRKKFQAEYQLLSQPFDLQNSHIIVHLHNPVQETMLNNLRSELSAYLRDQLKNNSITLSGELREAEEKKMIYTNREKFDYLVGKNPILKELKDRLGLDTDF